MRNNKLLLLLTIGCLLSLTTFFCISPFSNNTKENSHLKVEVGTQQKVKISKINYSSVGYGSHRISFEVNPKINSDEIGYSLKYSDKYEIEKDIFEVLFMPSKNYIDIKCLRPFEKRVVLTIYAISNENVKASINIDFKEKITINPTLEINENAPLSINSNLTTTGGSIKIDKTINDEKITLSNSFITTIKEKLKECFENKYYSNPQTTSYYQNSAIYYGIEDNDCSYWFANNFTYNDFLSSIYYEVDFSWIESDSDYEAFEIERVYLYDLLQGEFFEIFNGINPVFTYSCNINNDKYNCDLGLLIDKVNINNIKILDNDVVF